MEKLCEEELALILDRVSNPTDRKSCSLVSKKWWKMEALTRSSLAIKRDDPCFLSRLLSRFPNLLSFEANGLVTNSDLILLSETNPNLQILNLDYKPMHFFCAGGFTNAGLLQLASRCHNLHKICLNFRNLFTDTAVETLAASNPNLTTLELVNCLSVTDALPQNLADIPTKLEAIDFRGCSRVTDAGLVCLAGGKVSETLKHLVVAGCSITDHGLSSLASTKLEILNLEKCCSISNSGLSALAEGAVSKTLRDLVIARCKQITNPGLEAIASISLESLDMADCFKINDHGLLGFTKGDVSRTLKKLIISHDSFTDFGMLFLQRLRCLEELILCNCKHISDSGGIAISGIQTLKKLNFTCCHISDVTLVAVAQNCTGLIDITLTGCKDITGIGIRSFKNHKSLERLVILDSNGDVSAQDLEQIVIGSRSLKFLWLDRDRIKPSMTGQMELNIRRSCTIAWLGHGGAFEIQHKL